jgi:hypothetical protein
MDVLREHFTDGCPRTLDQTLALMAQELGCDVSEIVARLDEGLAVLESSLGLRAAA